MTVPPTESGEGDPGQVTRIAEEFIRLRDAGQLTDLDEDGNQWLTFQSNRFGQDYYVYVIQPNGSGLERLVLRRSFPAGEPPTDRSASNPRWSPTSWGFYPDGVQLHFGRLIWDFPGDPRGEPGEVRTGPRVDEWASWSPNDQLIAQHQLTQRQQGDEFRIFSAVDVRELHTVRDASGPYSVMEQHGNRWLDNHRLIFKDENTGTVHLWDTDSEEASEPLGLEDFEEFVFSEDGTTLYMKQLIESSDIWLLELAPEKVK